MTLWEGQDFTVEEGIDALSKAALTPAPEPDPWNVPGAMQERVSRMLDDGTVIQYEFAPSGWLTKAGEPRKQDWRAYFVVPPGEKRRRLPSVTTWLGEICPKDLTRWGEMHGIIGAVEAVRRGELDPNTHTDEDAVERVRALKLGADAARDRAATRGLDTHSVLEAWGKTGEFPDPAEFDSELQGYVRGLVDFLRDYDPEPSAVEFLVAHPERGYAGRVDMRAVCPSKAFPGVRKPRIVDLKTSPSLAIWPQAHLQTLSYSEADLRCGGPETDTPLIVVVAADGRYDVADCAVDSDALDRALSYYEVAKKLNASCQQRNRIARAA